MLQQDLDAHEDQDHAAGQLGFGAEAGAEDSAHPRTRAGQDEGGHADEQDGGEDIHLEEGEGNAHGQSIDAGGQRHGQHGLGREGAIHTAVILLPGLPDHVDADDAQQNEGDPVVNGYDHGLEPDAQQPAKQGHQGLETAEVGAADQTVGGAQLGDGQPLAHGYSEGVHGQPHSDNKQFP